MAKVLFLQNLWFEFMGPMSISAALKAAGHDCALRIGSSAGDFIPHLRRTKPDLVAFSAMTGMHRWVLDNALLLKRELGCRVILGGPHATFFPEIIDHPGVDIICRGEGEGAMVDLADALEAKADPAGIPNLWVKQENGEVVRADPRPLVEDLDGLPFPDRGLYDGYRALKDDPVPAVITSRGCPYNCSFCFNRRLAELYRGKGRYVRHRSPEPVIAELEGLKATRGARRIHFADDTFALNREWLARFLPLYRRRIALPFHCLVRIDQVDPELASLLRESGCETVFFGVESGDEKLRNEVLEKGISDAAIRRGARILKVQGIRFRAYNMVGLPGETLEQAWSTVRLNVEIGTDYPWCSVCTPYPGTRLAEDLAARGMAAERTADSTENTFFGNSPLPGTQRDRFTNLHKFFQTAVLFPRTIPLLRRLIGLPPNRFFRAWFGLVYTFLYLRSEGRGLARTLQLALRNRRALKGF